MSKKPHKKPVSKAKVGSDSPTQDKTPQKSKSSKIQVKIPTYIYKGHIECLKSARHFGFTPFEISVEKSDITKTKSLKNKAPKFEESDVLSFDNFLEEKVSIIRNYTEKKMQDLNQPPAICFSGPLKGSTLAEKNQSSKYHIFNLDVIGNNKSIAEAVVIETAYVILKEHHPDLGLVVEINSVGDKDSFARYSKDCANFYKKHLGDLPTDLKQLFKKDPLLLTTSTDDRLQLLKAEAPKSVNYLSEEARAHFREVLEFLESLDLPYTINESLIGSRNCSTGTVFQIVANDTQGKKPKRTILAIGERYNSIARKAFGKKEIPAIGAHILVDDKEAKKVEMMIVEEARFYFIHLGYEAKLKSLTILELLRSAKISVHQALSKDKITAQLQAAEKLGVPYILLVGQKEALENSVTIRHVETRVQETVRVDSLIEYLKKL